MDLPELLRPDEAARALNVSPMTLAVWRSSRTRRRSLAYQRIGSRIYYRISDIRKFLDAGHVTPAESAPAPKQPLRPRPPRCARKR